MSSRAQGERRINYTINVMKFLYKYFFKVCQQIEGENISCINYKL